jgi:hypothetical protein
MPTSRFDCSSKRNALAQSRLLKDDRLTSLSFVQRLHSRVRPWRREARNVG